jgi:hypothetical protein
MPAIYHPEACTNLVIENSSNRTSNHPLQQLPWPRLERSSDPAANTLTIIDNAKIILGLT